VELTAGLISILWVLLQHLYFVNGAIKSGKRASRDKIFGPTIA